MSVFNKGIHGFFAYLVGVNGGTVLMFWYDKQRAISKQWRVSEKTLTATALLGGWMGGFFAMKQFHHKTKKQSFLNKYYTATGINIITMIGIGCSPYGRKVLLPELKILMKQGIKKQGNGIQYKQMRSFVKKKGKKNKK